jgi:hypothetical protein
MDRHPLLLEITRRDAGTRELDDATRHLQNELASLEVLEVARPRALLPANTKALEPVLVNQLLLCAVGSGAIAEVLAGVIESWLKRHEGFNVYVQRADGSEFEIRR